MRETLPNQIRRLRRVRGLTQRQLGRMVGVSGSYISLIESGYNKPTPELLQDIRAALNWTDDAEQALAVLAQPTEVTT